MKITIDRNGKGAHVVIEREPMPPERFKALCNLAFAAIDGGVLLGVIHMVGFWAIPWAVGALALVGFYKTMKEGF